MNSHDYTNNVWCCGVRTDGGSCMNYKKYGNYCIWHFPLDVVIFIQKRIKLKSRKCRKSSLSLDLQSHMFKYLNFETQIKCMNVNNMWFKELLRPIYGINIKQYVSKTGKVYLLDKMKKCGYEFNNSRYYAELAIEYKQLNVVKWYQNNTNIKFTRYMFMDACRYASIDILNWWLQCDIPILSRIMSEEIYCSYYMDNDTLYTLEWLYSHNFYINYKKQSYDAFKWRNMDKLYWLASHNLFVLPYKRLLFEELKYDIRQDDIQLLQFCKDIKLYYPVTNQCIRYLVQHNRINVLNFLIFNNMINVDCVNNMKNIVILCNMGNMCRHRLCIKRD